jgi:hypothetical protein
MLERFSSFDNHHTMKTILMFGGRGWIGSLYAKNTTHRVILAKTRPEDEDACYEEIRIINPDSVFCCIGRTHGPGCNSIDYLESPEHYAENLRDNYQAPLTLAQICDDLHIHMFYVGTGCIYNYTEDKKIFTEDDNPNFFGSQYSIAKGKVDQEIQNYAVLNARIRMPISIQSNPRNFIDKIISYPKICSIPNSMTVLEDMFPIWDRMIERKTIGTYNMINIGVVEHNRILEIYKTYINPDHTWKNVTYEEQRAFLRSDRSNNHLDSSKLHMFCKSEGIILKHILGSIYGIFTIRKLGVDQSTTDIQYFGECDSDQCFESFNE